MAETVEVSPFFILLDDCVIVFFLLVKRAARWGKMLCGNYKVLFYF